MFNNSQAAISIAVLVLLAGCGGQSADPTAPTAGQSASPLAPGRSAATAGATDDTVASVEEWVESLTEVVSDCPDATSGRRILHIELGPAPQSADFTDPRCCLPVRGRPAPHDLGLRRGRTRSGPGWRVSALGRGRTAKRRCNGCSGHHHGGVGRACRMGGSEQPELAGREVPRTH